MTKILLTFLLLAITLVAAILVPAIGAFAQQTPPLIPHSLEGRTDCISCHSTGLAGAPKFPPDHAGRTNDMCQLCHKQAPSNAASPNATTAPRLSVTVTAPSSGIALPTAIPHIQTASKNSCVTCHSQQGGKLAADVKDWQSSIHAERNVNCVDCHGGNASADKKEDAMAPSAGYIGIPKKGDIPKLCASCHARVEQMRQYDLPTDQWAKYQTSIHGQKLAQGDTNVATCFVCHDGHATKSPKDPSSQVYPLNVPGLCAGCHANAELMKPYNIPTNQFELYVKSVHGIALLGNQDLRAPSCATCHGTHGAAPPGFEEVANVCGSCHSATQDYFLKSVHASEQPGTPKCVTCHGRYDVGTPSDSMFAGSGSRECGSCHPSNSPEAQTVQALYDQITAASKAVDDAEMAIQRASGSALIVAPEEAKLREARTNLITARAAQHTLDINVVKGKTDIAVADAKQVATDANKSIDDSIFRREVMGVGLGIMALAIASLWMIRRELYKDLPPK